MTERSTPLIGERSALVVIDMQRIFRDTGSQWCTPGYDEASAGIARLLDAFRGDVIWTRFVRDPAESGSWADYYERWDRCREPEGSPVWDLTMNRRAEDAVLSLPTFSKWGPELAELTTGRDLVVCGVATDCCVLSTVLGAVDAGKRVTVVADASAGATDRAHDQAIELMELLSPMVTVSDAERVLAARR